MAQITVQNDLSSDPFYSQENQERLQKSISDLDAGKGQIHEVEYEQIEIAQCGSHYRDK